MDQPITPTPPVFTQTPVEPEPPKKSYTWLIVIVIIFLLAGSSVLTYKYYQLKHQVTQTQPSPSPSATPIVQSQPSAQAQIGNWRTITGKYWTFEVPKEWYFIKCLDGNPIILSPNLREEDKDTINDCNFGMRSFLEIKRSFEKFSIPVSYTSNPSDLYKFYMTVLNKKEITIDGRKVIKQIEEKSGGQDMGTHTMVYIEQPTFTDILFFWDTDKNASTETIDQILSTFKFTN